MNADLESLLEDLHQAALHADFNALAALTPAVGAATEALDARRDPAAARRIAALAQRNATCLDAALRGLRAGRRRLAELRGLELGLRTYDRNGQAAGIVTAPQPARRF
jgi:hypothetical protein